MRYVGGALTPEQAEQALREGLADAEGGRAWGTGPGSSKEASPATGSCGRRTPAARTRGRARASWGTGSSSATGARALPGGSRELLRYGFEDLGLTRIMTRAAAANEASRATMLSRRPAPRARLHRCRIRERSLCSRPLSARIPRSTSRTIINALEGAAENQTVVGGQVEDVDAAS
ncbi:GNAT family N-acetyltransferase [Streptomyces acidicola]|uniref:GNAT family N-acetyltransferase n=1 Tax=Streptomyces acidicola TaxID=2596892 RepID=UPI003437901E